jgi:hypothetical protein
VVRVASSCFENNRLEERFAYCFDTRMTNSSAHSMESQTLLDSLRMHQHETSVKTSNRDQLEYMLQLIQACEIKGAHGRNAAGQGAMLSSDEIRTIKESILAKLESLR